MSEPSDDGQLRRREIKGRMLWGQEARGFEEAINLCKGTEKRRKMPVTSARLGTIQYSLCDIFILNKEKEIWALVLGKQESNKSDKWDKKLWHCIVSVSTLSWYDLVGFSTCIGIYRNISGCHSHGKSWDFLLSTVSWEKSPTLWLT